MNPVAALRQFAAKLGAGFTLLLLNAMISAFVPVSIALYQGMPLDAWFWMRSLTLAGACNAIALIMPSPFLAPLMGLLEAL